MTRILLLEDDPDIADALQMMLELRGWEMRRTASGRQAVLLAAREPFDLAILDVDVEELSGIGAELAISDFASIPSIVFSASTGSWEAAAFRAGAAACLHKPSDVDRLPDVIETLIGTGHDEGPLDIVHLPAEDVARLCARPPEELERLPFGIIKLDRAGVIIGYNAYEAWAAEVEPGAVLGRRFADVAPCTQVKQFVEAVAEGFETGQLDRVLRFVFPCRGALAAVSVRLYLDGARQQLWLFVSRRALRRADRLAAAATAAPAP